MSKELLQVLIEKMHSKLNKLIEDKDFNLLDDNVQRYSRRLDRVLLRYNRFP